MSRSSSTPPQRPSALYLWIVPSEYELDQPGRWRIRKWDTEPFPEANYTASETARTTPHLIADKASDREKSTAFEWLRGIALGTPAAVNDPRAAKLAAIAMDEWHRCREAETNLTIAREGLIQELGEMKADLNRATEPKCCRGLAPVCPIPACEGRAPSAARFASDYYCGPCNWSGKLPEPESGHPKCPDCGAYLSKPHDAAPQGAAPKSGLEASETKGGVSTPAVAAPSSVVSSARLAMPERQCLRAMTDGRCSAPHCMCPIIKTNALVAQSHEEQPELNRQAEGSRSSECSTSSAQNAAALTMPEGLHPKTADLVVRFATALAEKLRKAERDYGYGDGWSGSAWEAECRAALYEHLEKGDPRDVANFCAFMWHHGWSTKPAVPAGERKVWLWKNFVDGRPEYWAFDNPYPCHENGDPITLGEPCGYAIVKQSKQGRHDVSEAQVIEAIKRASARSATRHTAAITQHGLLDATADMLDAHGYGGAAKEVRKAKKEMPDCPITNWGQHGL